MPGTGPSDGSRIGRRLEMVARDTASQDLRARNLAAFVTAVVTVLLADALAERAVTLFVPGTTIAEMLAGRGLESGGVRLLAVMNDGGSLGLPGSSALLGLAGWVLTGLIIAWVVRGRGTSDVGFNIAVGLFVGGSLGNAIARLRDGGVLDYLDVGPARASFITFNVADLCIVAAIALTGAQLLPRPTLGVGRGPRHADEQPIADVGGRR